MAKNKEILKVSDISGSSLTSEQCYKIAQKYYDYCLLDHNDKPFLAPKVIPLIFDDCLKEIGNDNSQTKNNLI